MSTAPTFMVFPFFMTREQESRFKECDVFWFFFKTYKAHTPKELVKGPDNL